MQHGDRADRELVIKGRFASVGELVRKGRRRWEETAKVVDVKNIAKRRGDWICCNSNWSNPVQEPSGRGGDDFHCRIVPPTYEEGNTVEEELKSLHGETRRRWPVEERSIDRTLQLWMISPIVEEGQWKSEAAIKQMPSRKPGIAQLAEVLAEEPPQTEKMTAEEQIWKR